MHSILDVYYFPFQPRPSRWFGQQDAVRGRDRGGDRILQTCRVQTPRKVGQEHGFDCFLVSVSIHGVTYIYIQNSINPIAIHPFTSMCMMQPFCIDRLFAFEETW